MGRLPVPRAGKRAAELLGAGVGDHPVTVGKLWGRPWRGLRNPQSSGDNIALPGAGRRTEVRSFLTALWPA